MFNKDFGVLKEKDCGQTTLGINVAIDYQQGSDYLSTVILDIEGNDSNERNGNLGNEWFYGAYGIVFVDILIINIHKAKALSRKTDFIETCLLMLSQYHIYNKISKKTLVFCVRDFKYKSIIQKQEKERELATLIKKIVEELWEKIKVKDKPRFYSSVFDLEYFTLPHFRDKKEDFSKGVKEMRQKIQSKNSSWNKNLQLAKQSPIEILPLEAKTLFDSLKKNNIFNMGEVKKNAIEEILKRKRQESCLDNYRDVIALLRNGINNVKQKYDYILKLRTDKFTALTKDYVNEESLKSKYLNEIKELTKNNFLEITNSMIERIKTNSTTEIKNYFQRNFEEMRRNNSITVDSYSQFENQKKNENISSLISSLQNNISQDFLPIANLNTTVQNYRNYLDGIIQEEKKNFIGIYLEKKNSKLINDFQNEINSNIRSIENLNQIPYIVKKYENLCSSTCKYFYL